MARLTDSSYEIARPSGVCAASGERIAPGAPYVAVLVEREGQEGMERLDYAAERWDAGARPGPPLRVFGSWRAVMHDASAPQRAFIDDEALLDLLERLEGAQEPSRLSFRYVLTLLLVRKRLLKFEGARQAGDGTHRLMLVRRATPAGATPGPLLEVADPCMDEGAIAAAVEQLGSIMNGEPA
jgi:hypothetical protein